LPEDAFFIRWNILQENKHLNIYTVLVAVFCLLFYYLLINFFVDLLVVYSHFQLSKFLFLNLLGGRPFRSSTKASRPWFFKAFRVVRLPHSVTSHIDCVWPNLINVLGTYLGVLICTQCSYRYRLNINTNVNKRSKCMPASLWHQHTESFAWVYGSYVVNLCSIFFENLSGSQRYEKWKISGILLNIQLYKISFMHITISMI